MAYRQCVLRRGATTLVSWIPATFAVVGQTLRLKGQDGWRVEWASAPMPAGWVEANARNYLKQRHASDVVFADVVRENRSGTTPCSGRP